MKTIEINGERITFRYYEQSLKNVLENANLSIEKGSITVLTGKSGCGKSTMAAILAGLYPENGGVLTGNVLIDGQPIGALLPNKRVKFVSMMFQNCDLQFCMDTLRNEIRFCLENCAVVPEKMDKIVRAAAQKTGVTELLDRVLQTLSGGEKQKAALCCILALGSSCIILDEPFANIDPGAADELAIMLARISREDGLTILVVDHQVERWIPLVDEIILMGEKGKLLCRGIHKSNIRDFQTLFRQSGVAFPGIKKRAYPLRQGGKPVLELENLTLNSVEECLIEDSSAVFLKGTMTAVMGASGSGKTTLFRALIGQHPYKGELLLHGKRLPPNKKHRYYKIGIVFQNPSNQFVSQRVEDEVKYSLHLWKKGKQADWYEAEAGRLLSVFGLKQYHNYSPHMLSQGQQRRLAVLSMLAGGQEILLLDEPTYGQDDNSAMAIMELLAERVKEGLTVIFSTHDAGLAKQWADRVYILKERRLVLLREGR